jgi:hypothetical protein
METKEGLLAICGSMIGRSVSTEGVSYYVQIDSLERLVEIPLLERKLARLDKTQFTEKEKEMADLFFSSLQSRRKQEKEQN